MKNLSKENFWNKLQEKYPLGMKIFCDWIDEYKKRNNWDLLFCNSYLKARNLNQTKFHDIPYAMQIGIWIEFVCERGGCAFEVDLFEYDWRKEIKEYIKMLHKEEKSNAE